MPLVGYSPEEIEPILLNRNGYKSLLLRLRVTLLQIEADYGDKEELTVLKGLIDKVLLQYMRTQEHLQDRSRLCPTTTL